MYSAIELAPITNDEVEERQEPDAERPHEEHPRTGVTDTITGYQRLQARLKPKHPRAVAARKPSLANGLLADLMVGILSHYSWTISKPLGAHEEHAIHVDGLNFALVAHHGRGPDVHLLAQRMHAQVDRVVLLSANRLDHHRL